MKTKKMPFLVLTMGDPNSIGPEITAKAVQQIQTLSGGGQTCKISGKDIDITPLGKYTLVIVGNYSVFQRVCRDLGISVDGSALSVHVWPFENFDLSVDTGLVSLLPTMRSTKAGSIIFVSLSTPEYAHAYGEESVDAAMEALLYIKVATAIVSGLPHGDGALVTNAINKSVIAKIEEMNRYIPLLGYAQFRRVGHTELIQGLTGSPYSLVLFETQGTSLRVVFVTRHLSLRDAVKKCGDQGFLDAELGRILPCLQTLDIFSSARKHNIAMAALNPHASDGGLFGSEEELVLQPICDKYSIDLVPSDSVFHLCKEGAYDCVLSLYHDQGHIATKTFDFYGTISITLGYPFLRTSVDHGTAFGIAGSGSASEYSLVCALLTAAKYTGLYKPK